MYRKPYEPSIHDEEIPASTLVMGAICGMTLAALLYPVLIAAMSISPPSI